MRQINEGVRIAYCEADICMNSKAEFHQPSIVTLGNNNEEQTGPYPQRGAGRGARRGRGQGRRWAKPFIYKPRESSLVPEGSLTAQILQKL